MTIYDVVKNTIKEHKAKIEFTQQAIIAGVASLIYSDYISLLKQKTIPVGTIVVVPAIKTVQHLLSTDGPFMQMLSDSLIDTIALDNLFRQYADAPEFELFKSDKIEILKTIFDLYILPNVSRVIPEAIAKKFGLYNTGNNPFREDPDIPLLQGDPARRGILRYVKDQIVLQLLVGAVVTIPRDIENPEGNLNIQMTDDEILKIDSDQALCPIYFNRNIFENKAVIDTLKFVTSTTLSDWRSNDIAPAIGPDQKMVSWSVTTNVFNRVSLITLHHADNTGADSTDNTTMTGE